MGMQGFKMDRQNFRIVASVAAMAAALPVCSGSAAEAKRPNVIVMIADDLGYGDVSCLMRSVVATPNLDRLAKDGVKFTAGYASCPLCAPSRNGFLTGRYQERFGSMNNATFTIPREVPVFSEIFRKAGYTTGLLGKWHSGDKPGFRPFERGFQEFYGYYGPFLNYREPRLYRNDAAKPVAEREYSTDAFAREAEEFIERHKGEPFFLNVAFNAPHIPRVIKHAGEVLKMFEEHPEEFKRKGPRELKDYMSRPGEDQKYLAQFDNDWGRADTVACITALDQAVGRILDKLHQTALDRRNIVFFFSDNGGHPENRSENLPLYGYKWSTYEGGFVCRSSPRIRAFSPLD